MGLIPEEIIAEVIDRSDIVETISTYIPLKQTGRNFKAHCPFHNEKTPSFIVNPDKQIFHCFGCGTGGNVVTFIMKQDHIEFPEAIRLLAQKVNVSIPSDVAPKTETINERQLIFKIHEAAAYYFHKNLLSDKDKAAKKARDYLKKRDISLETVKKFQLGFARDQWDGLFLYLNKKKIAQSLMEKAGVIIPRENAAGYYDRFRNRIVFPIFDTRGHCRAFGARLLETISGAAGKNTAKYINSPETAIYTKGHHLFGFHLAKQSIIQEDCVVIVEGYMDCLMPDQSGVTNVVASLGTALTVEQIRLLRHYTKNVCLLFDMDTAGESAMLRSLDNLLEEGMHIKVATLEIGQDPDSFIREYGVESFRDRIRDAQTLFDYKLSILLERYDAKTVEGKAKISGALLPTIDKFNNAVIKSGYIRHLADVLHIAEAALITELKNASQLSVRRNAKTVKTAGASDAFSERQHRAVERNILKLLLEEKSLIPVTKDKVAPSDFQDAKFRDIISKIYELYDQGKDVSSLTLINSFEDQQIQQMITGLVAKEETIVGDKIKIHKDYIHRIQHDRLKLHRQDLLRQIREAEISGDHSKVDLLKEKFNQSIKR